jgi:GH25 family lysozyme M1 (1,4-beta-N-acetylmuramidase)
MTYQLKQPAIYDFSSWEDVSAYQWDSIAATNPLAVIMRASIQGAGTRNRFEDTKAVEYSNACKARGIRTGLYHFLSPNGIAEQAALFLSVWNKCGGANIVPIVDVEIDLQVSYGGTIGQAVWQSHIKTFLDLIAAGTGKTPMIYTNKNYWGFTYTRVALWKLAPPAWTGDYPLWLAWYPTLPDQFDEPPVSIIPGGWKKWAIWQWEDGGRTNGYLANDLNIASLWYAAELNAIVDPPIDPPILDWPDKLTAVHDGVSKDYLPNV